MLVGCCIALGYEITKKNLDANIKSNSTLDISEQSQKAKHYQYNNFNPGEKTNAQNYNRNVQKTLIKVIPTIESNSQEKLHIPQNSNEHLNSLKEEGLEVINPGIKKSVKAKQEQMDHDVLPELFNLETESFFKKHSIDEMFETLPNLKNN